jgi:hypothetical protein
MQGLLWRTYIMETTFAIARDTSIIENIYLRDIVAHIL